MSDRIVLGPPKMSFASSSLGGLKRSEDSLSGLKKSLETPRENRTPRGPPSALEQGFGRETIEKLSSHKLPKVTPKDITGLLSGMDRRRLDPSRNSSSLTGSRTSTNSTTSRVGSLTRSSGQPLSSSATSLSSSTNNSNINNSNGIGLSYRTQRSDAPEWMSYNPESESMTKESESGGEPQVFVDDIQAWKARMKEHERREKEKETSTLIQRDNKQDPRLPSRADSSSSWRSSVSITAQSTEAIAEAKQPVEAKALPALDKPLGRALLSGEPIQDIDIFFSPGGIDLSKPFDSSSAFDKFLSQHAVAVSSFDDSALQKPARKADGSRFARFFAEDEPEPVKESEQPAPMTRDMPGKQLSLDQLFQAHAPTSASVAPPPPPPLGRMPSEAEILESLKVNKSPVPAKPAETNEQSEDAFAFSKIMAALSKPPVSDTETAFGVQALSNGSPSSSASMHSSGTTPTLHDPSIVTFQSKPTLLDALRKPASESSMPQEPVRTTSSSAPSENSQSQGSNVPTVSAPLSTTSSETIRPASRPVQVAFGGGIPTSVYRQLSGKTDGQKSASPLIRPLSSTNGSSMNGSGASPSLSSPSMSSPHQFSTQAGISTPQLGSQQQRPQTQSANMQQPSQPVIQQQPPQQQQPMNKNFGPYNQGPGAVLQSPVMDPRLSGMYGSGGPSPMGGHGHGMENDPPGFFNGMPIQRPGQGVPPQFAQQMPPFSQQMHVSGPGDFMAPHPSQFVGMPPFGAPMHPGMFPMNPVEMLMHRGPGGPPPPRPMPGLGPGPGPNHFVPNNFGHPMNGMPHPGLPMNPPPFFPPQVSKPMMTREEFERRNRQ
ncbi:hypothetical protein BC939DRAFT_166163 [Gamsiella multidivaricata]|uniref:uncharacterized protein n=1 Tax=Gamsiella multidivaricata TaxID=101098 RepID=UPI00221FEA7F|nr:uncharacterized protein BC939DRAFT_166163 [Gamsiella multidivaricata]KAI7823189.1 hypothetical protein BC939DRAFT_166163 [Gamsiella multidivaricata]